MRLGFILSFIFSMLLISSISFAALEFSIGVSPPIIDVGSVEQGSTKIVKFYLVTPSTEPLLVYLESEPGSIDFFNRAKYASIVYNYSEENVVSWAEFLKNPIELTPSNETLKTKGGEINGWREISFLLNVPENAEPGYHLMRIKPVPTVPNEVLGQTGARVVAIVGVNVLLNVLGDANRDGFILDVTPGNYIGNKLEIDTYFKNTGTVTISASASQNIYNSDESIANISSSRDLIKPGEVKILKSLLPTKGVSSGDFDVFTTVSYSTGSVSKNSTITISPPAIIALQPQVFPWYIIILIIVILALAIWIYRWRK